MKFSEIATNATAGWEMHCEGGWGYNPHYAIWWTKWKWRASWRTSNVG